VNRIDESRASCGNQAGDKRNCRENQSDDKHRPQIVGADAKKEALE
jgi:hypothetical protein